MLNLKMVIPGNAYVKKNTKKPIWFRWATDEHGFKKQIPLAKPHFYYTKQYKEWALKAVEKVTIFKSNYIIKTGNIFPIMEPIFLTCIFFISADYKVDLSNLIEGMQDVLSGDAGKAILGKKFDHSKYQILHDDNRKIVRNLGGSTIFYDPINPRTEVYLSSYSDQKWGQIMNLLHPDQSVGVPDDSIPQITLDFGSAIQKPKDSNTDLIKSLMAKL